MSCKNPYLTPRRLRSLSACAAALNPVQADAYLLTQEQFNSIFSHLRSTDRITDSELEQFLSVDGREIWRSHSSELIYTLRRYETAEEEQEKRAINHT
jgi:hypothetical protein